MEASTTSTSSAPEPYFPVTPARLVDTRCSISPEPSFCSSEHLPAANANLATLGAARTGWSSPETLNAGYEMNYVSCPNSSFCMAMDYSGPTFTWNGATWSSVSGPSVPNLSGIEGLSCASASFCVAVDLKGNVFTWNGTNWSAPQPVDPGQTPILDVDCPSESFCAASDFSGSVLLYREQPGNSTITVQVAGVDGVPAGAVDVVLNVTVTDTTSGGYLTVYPAGDSVPSTSSLNFRPHETVANLVEVALSPAGQVSVTLGGSTGQADVVVDLEGYVVAGSSSAPGDSFQPMAPERIADTRCFNPSYASANSSYCKAISNQVSPETEVPAQGSVTISVPSNLSSASAIVANLTVTDTTAPGFLTAYPADASVPFASNLNFTAGETVANRMEVPLSSGAFSIYNGSNAPVDVVVDLNGTYTSGTGALFEGITPSRIVDTRCGEQPQPSFCLSENLPVANASLTTLGPDGTITVQVNGSPGFPSGATAIVANLTAVSPQALGYLTVYPAGSARPVISDVNFAAGVPAIANMMVAELGSSTSIEIYNGSDGDVNVLVDITGYFVPAS